MDEKSKINDKVVQTYAEDMADVISDDHGGLIKKIIHEEESKEEDKMVKSPEAKRNKYFALGGSFLVIISFVIIGFILVNNKVDTVGVETPFTSMIFNDATAFIEVADLDKNQIVQSVRREIETKELKPGGVEGIYLTLENNIIGLRKFNELMKSSLDIELNSFVDDNFLLGFINSVDGRDAFMLIQTRSFTDIFQDMREWEDKMFNDLHGLFGVALTAETAPLLTKDFENVIIQNKNARVLYQTDAEGKNRGVIMYVFVDDTHVLITKNESTTREVITRLLGNNIR